MGQINKMSPLHSARGENVGKHSATNPEGEGFQLNTSRAIYAGDEKLV